MVSPAVFSGPSEGGESWETVRVGLGAEDADFAKEGEVWERGLWLLEMGVVWGWLGERLEELWVERLFGGVGCELDDWCFIGGVARGSGVLNPGGVTGGKERDVSSLVRLPSGD